MGLKNCAVPELRLRRKPLLAAAVMAALGRPFLIGVLFVCAGRAQSQAAGGSAQSFEVASIKPNRSGARNTGFKRFTGGELDATNITLKMLIVFAYDTPQERILQGPAWLDSERYDILAKPDAGPDRPVDRSAGAIKLRTQTLLADRFKLQFHRERRLVAGYALTVAKGGVIAKVSALPDGRSGGNGGRGWIHSVGAPFSALVIRLSDLLQRPVVDNTQDARRFDFDLRWSPDVEPLGAASPASDGPSLFTALEEQLGLRLVAQRVQAVVLVIDHAELPSEN